MGSVPQADSTIDASNSSGTRTAVDVDDGPAPKSDNKRSLAIQAINRT